MYNTAVTRELFQKKQLFVFDMDGTIYLGNRVFPEALSFINHLRESGKKILFFTNNASRSKSVYVNRLSNMGFTSDEKEILTSGDVTIDYLKNHEKGKNVYLLGTAALWKSFSESGISLVNDEKGKLLSQKKADIVVSSFDTELTYEKINIACRLIREGARYYSTHPDYNCPIEGGFMPDSGAIAALITASTQVEPKYLGKPYVETLEAMMRFCVVKKEEIVLFGDRLYTDIALGKKNGVTSVLVLSGETISEDLNSCSEKEAPDFVFENLGELDQMLI